MHLTQGARYEAARRNKKKNRTSIVSVITLSLYAIFFSLYSTFDKLVSAEQREVLALLTVFMSSFIIAFSVYEALKRYDARSELFLRSAREIQGLRDQLTAKFVSGTIDWDILDTFEAKYFRILDSYSDNHSDFDFNTFRAKIGKMPPSQAKKAKNMLLLSTWWIFLFSLLSPAFIYLLYFIAVYAASAIPSRPDARPQVADRIIQVPEKR